MTKAALWRLFTTELSEFSVIWLWSDGGPQHYGTQEAIAWVCGSDSPVVTVLKKSHPHSAQQCLTAPNNLQLHPTTSKHL